MNAGFILDASSSVKGNFQKEKDFMKRLAASFGIDQNGTKAGVISYSDIAESSIKFKDHQNIQSFWDAADIIPLLNSKSRIDKALKLADTEMFSLASGAKPAVTNLLIIITTGTQSNDADAEDPVAISEAMVKSGVNVIAVGIGSNVDENRLRAMTGDQSKVFMVKSFDDLNDPALSKDIENIACQTGKYFLSTLLFTQGTVLA